MGTLIQYVSGTLDDLESPVEVHGRAQRSRRHRVTHELDAPPWLRVETTLMATARELRSTYDDRFAPLALNLSQASLLAFVSEFGASSQTSLAQSLKLGRAATGTLIDQLEARELVRRLPDPEDRRVWLIEATAAGLALSAEVLEIDKVVRKELRRGISKQERQQLASLLLRLRQNLATVSAEGTHENEAAAAAS